MFENTSLNTFSNFYAYLLSSLMNYTFSHIYSQPMASFFETNSAKCFLHQRGAHQSETKLEVSLIDF